jgi:GAF domain-containing protein
MSDRRRSGGLAGARGIATTTDVLLSIGDKLARAEDPHEIARVVTEMVKGVFGADVSAVTLRRPDGAFTLAHAAGEMTDRERDILRTHRFNHPSHAILARDRRVLAIDDVAMSGLADPAYLALIPRRSTMLVPFVRGEELLGYWGIHYIHQHHHFRPHEIALAEGIGRQAAMGLDNLRLRAVEREKAAQLLEREREAARLEGAIETARGVAHELNQPLGIIAGQAELLRQLTDPRTPIGDLSGNLEDIQEAASVLTQKILRLQGVVRVETSDIAGVGRYVDLERSTD